MFQWYNRGLDAALEETYLRTANIHGALLQITLT